MSIQLASAYVDVIPSMRGTQARLTKGLGAPAEKAGNEAGKRMGRGLGSMAVRVAAPLLAGIGLAKAFSFAKGAVDEFSQLEDASAAAGQVFGKSFKIIQKESRTAAKDLGMSKSQYMDAAIQMGVFGKSAGKTGTDLADFSTEMVAVAGDMASFRGTTPEEAIEAVGAALRGESEPIRKYGVLLDDATLRQRALKMGLIETTKDALTPQQKALAAQQEILAQTKDAQGDFARTADSTANVAKRQEAEFKNLQATIGEKLAPAFTWVRAKGILLMSALTAFIGEMQSGEGTGGRFAAVMMNVGDAIADAGRFIVKHQEIFKALAAAYAGFVIGKFIGSMIQSVIWWGRDTAAAIANRWAKVSNALVTGRLVAMYTGQWIAAQARSIAGWVRETAAMAANRAGVVAQAIARKASSWVLFLGMQTRAILGWVRETAVMVANRAASMAVAAGHLAVRGALAIATAAQWLWNAALSANPIGIVIVAVAALVGALVWFFTKTEFGRKVVTKAWSAIQGAIRVASNFWTRVAWPAIRGAIQALGNGFRNAGHKIAAVWRAIVSTAKGAWIWIRDKVFGPIGRGINNVRLAFRVAGLGIRIIWTALRAALRAGWQWINDKVFARIRAGIAAVRFAFRVAKVGIGLIWSGLKSTLRAGWNWVEAKVFAPFKRGIRAIGTAFGKAKDVIQSTWNKIKKVATAPINFVIREVYMGGVRKLWNKIAGAVGLDKLKLPVVNEIKGYDRGGWTGPGPKLMPAGIVHADEFVLRKWARQKVEAQAPGLLDHMNKTGQIPIPGYAGGGTVAQLIRAANWWRNLGARASEHPKFGGVHAGHMKGSLHYSGRAVDLNYGPGGQNAREMAFFDRNMGRFRAMFPQLGVLWRTAGHFNHAHIDTGGWGKVGKGGSGGGMGIFDFVSGFTNLLGKVKQIGKSNWAQVLGGAAKKFITWPMEYAKKKWGDDAEGAGTVGRYRTDAVVDAVRAVAKKYGWGSGAQWNALDWIINKESSWNPSAKNPSSSARGLFQKMTSIHGPLEGSVKGQANWGLRYIKGRYGSPARAKAFHQSHGYYFDGGRVTEIPYMGVFDSGGLVPPGKSVVDNRTGGWEDLRPYRPEDDSNSKAPMVGTMVVADPREAIHELEAMKRRSRIRNNLNRRAQYA